MSKSKWMRSSAILLVAAVVGLPVEAMAAIHIKLKVNEQTNPATLEVSDNPAQCPGGKLDCIEVPKGYWHNLFFELDNACEPEGPKYKLSSFRIAMKDKDWPTSANPLDAKIADDFGADPTSGYINLSAGGNDKSDDRIKFKDKNREQSVVFYEIIATECTGTGEIKLDPVIRNGGGGNP